MKNKKKKKILMIKFKKFKFSLLRIKKMILKDLIAKQLKELKKNKKMIRNIKI
jgi:hypothetical protein